MGKASKVVDFMKTRTGKLFAALLALSIVFAFSSLAYGTGEEPELSVEDIAAQTDEALADTEGADDPDTAGDSLDGEGLEEGEVPEEAPTEMATPDELLTQVITRTELVDNKNAQIIFGLGDDSDATVKAVDGTELAIGVPILDGDDPEKAPTDAYTFRVVPGEGHEIKSVKFVSVKSDRKTEKTIEEVVEVPQPGTASDDTQEEADDQDAATVEPAAQDDASALADEGESTAADTQETPATDAEDSDDAVVDDSATEPSDPTGGSEDAAEPADKDAAPSNEETDDPEEGIDLKAINAEKDAENPFAMTYQIDLDDLTKDGVGCDVAVVIITQKIKFDAWWKIVEALEAGIDVKLDTNDSKRAITVGALPAAAEGEEAQELTAWQASDNNKQAVVGKGNPTLDLNGFKIIANDPLNPSADSLIAVSSGAGLTIVDQASSSFVVKGGASDGTLTNGGSVNEGNIGNTGTVDGDTITYFVTTSSPIGDGATSETLYTQTITLPELSGRIEAHSSDIKNLVNVDSGATADIQGGVFTNQAGRGINNAGALNMTGGAIVSCTLESDTGAGILSTGSADISGSAVIAGNKVTGNGTSWNGGGISAMGGTLNIAGDAVVATNRTDGDASPAGNILNYNPDGTGGGIFASGASVSLSGSCRIASNEAKYYGGGLNIESSASLSVSGDAVITNNKTTYSREGDDNKNWAAKTMGGGGVHTLGNMTVAGGQITANISADGGGGVFAYNTGATFTMGDGGSSETIIASNLAKMSEGGGLYLMPAAGSKITAGYITNNATQTPFDFGGGGLYVANEAKDVEIWHPIVTNNTASAYGGGVANCQNGMTISDKAGIFDNTALGAVTSNTSVEVDHWIKSLGIDPSKAMDFVGGKRSEIWANMLGGDPYNWTGYMSYQPTYENQIAITQNSWSDKNVKVNGSTILSGTSDIGGLTWQPSGYYQLSVFESAMTPEEAAQFNEQLSNAKTSVNRPGVVEKNEGLSVNHVGGTDDGKKYGDSSYYLADDGAWYFAFTIEPDPWADLDYTKDIWSKRPTNATDVDDANWTKRDLLYTLSSDPNAEEKTYSVTREGVEKFGILEAAKTNTGNGATIVKWPIAEITKFPEDGFVWTNRFLCLTAHPDESGKAQAKAMGNLFITGNYSATNGGGIANNGQITIGEDPNDPYIPEEPTKKYDKVGVLDITKVFDGAFDANKNGSALATFSVVQYASKEAYTADKPLMEDIVTFNFTEGGSQTYTWPGDVRAGQYFVIKELDVINGDNAVDSIVNTNTKVVPIEYVEQGSETITKDDGTEVTITTYKPIALASFKNTFNNESFTTSIINHYKKGEAGFTFDQLTHWTDGDQGADQPEEDQA